MKQVPFRDIYLKKIERQKQIKELEYHAFGDCIHIGKISLSCENCFLRKDYESFAIYCGVECNLNCPICYYDENRKDYFKRENNLLNELFGKSIDPNFKPKYVSFNTEGESLLYLDNFKKFADIVNKIEDDKEIKIYRHIYTNGILINNDTLKKLKDMRIDEIRFHISASNFSEKVFENMKLAKERNFIITVEEPSFPLYRDKLIKSLSLLEEIGIKHLDMVEVQITYFNKTRIEKLYPQGVWYKNVLHHLYDEGMVYDIMEEVIKKQYSFSVLDCNSDVEKHRRCRPYDNIDQTMMKGAT